MEALASIAPFLIIALLFWLLLIRPAQRRQREMQRVQGSAGVGSEIMLTSGVYGTVVGEDADTLQVQIAPGTVIKVVRGAVATVLSGEREENDVPLDDLPPADLDKRDGTPDQQ